MVPSSGVIGDKRVRALSVAMSYLALAASLCACGPIISTATNSFAESLSAGILNQNDIATVRDGAPAYLLLVDGFIAENPGNEALLLAGAELYSSYAGAFVADAARAQRLAARAKQYGHDALCGRSERLCEAADQPHEQWVTALATTTSSDLPALFGFGASWATWIQLNSGDWNAVAEVPKVEAAMRRVIELDSEFRQGWPQLYLGVLNTQLPPAYGGKPEQGRAYFERAMELSQESNLMVHVLFAQQYARLVFDQELHDDLLSKALEKSPMQPNLTLINTLAQQQAKELLAGSADYF